MEPGEIKKYKETGTKGNIKYPQELSQILFILGVKLVFTENNLTINNDVKKSLQVGSPCQQVLEWQCSVFSWSLNDESDQKDKSV